MFENKRIVVTGGTGSLGERLVRRLLSVRKPGGPARSLSFPVTRPKQHAMRPSLRRIKVATDEIIYQNTHRVEFRIGDVRDIRAVSSAAPARADVVFHASALKQVPSCEYFPSDSCSDQRRRGRERRSRAFAESGPAG